MEMENVNMGAILDRISAKTICGYLFHNLYFPLFPIGCALIMTHAEHTHTHTEPTNKQTALKSNVKFSTILTKQYEILYLFFFCVYQFVMIVTFKIDN